MRITRTAVPVVIGIAALLGVSATSAPATGSSANQARGAVVADGPVARAAGDSGGPPAYPSIVDVRLTRAEAGLARATTAFDQGQEAAAIPEIIAARDNMVKAWSAAKYVIAQTPPVDPEAEDAGGPFAAPADTAAAVLNLQHEIVTTSLGMLDAAGPELALALRGTISGTMTVRDTAINHLHDIAPPPVAEEGSLAPVGGTYDVVMPMIAPQLDDEIMQANGSAMSSATAANFGAWTAFRAAGTRNLINTYWPPVVDD